MVACNVDEVCLLDEFGGVDHHLQNESLTLLFIWRVQSEASAMASNSPCGVKIGAALHVRLVFGARKCSILWMVIG
jgi:hypothetical protein